MFRLILRHLAILPAIHGVAAHVASKQPEIALGQTERSLRTEYFHARLPAPTPAQCPVATSLLLPSKALEARGLLTHSEMQQSLPQLELSLDDDRSVQQDHECGEDSDDACSANSGDEGRNELEPISKEAIELPARVVWAEWRF